MTTDDFARNVYEYYSNEAGDKSLRGAPLPTWDEFRSEDEHKTHYQAWLNTMTHAVGLLESGPLTQSPTPPPPVVEEPTATPFSRRAAAPSSERSSGSSGARPDDDR